VPPLGAEWVVVNLGEVAEVACLSHARDIAPLVSLTSYCLSTSCPHPTPSTPPTDPTPPLHPLLGRISTHLTPPQPHLNRISTASQPHLNQRLRHAWQVASGGYLLATPHRVLSTPVTRLSVPFFYNPSLETVVEPLALPSSLAWERDAAYDSQTRRRS
jgi:hypothetical protein